jgi:hypothetical protein
MVLGSWLLVCFFFAFRHSLAFPRTSSRSSSSTSTFHVHLPLLRIIRRVIIALGAPTSIITGFDIDTAHFTGNYGPEASVWGMKLEGGEEEVRKEEGVLDGDDPRVRLLIPHTLFPVSVPLSFISFSLVLRLSSKAEDPFFCGDSGNSSSQS